MSEAPELVYRACTALDDFRQCLRLQKEIWHFADVDVLPTRLFIVAHEIGGQNFGAFEPGGRLAGFVLSLPGVRHFPAREGAGAPGGTPYFHSHMLGVLPQYQNHGVGRRLKLMQRDDALARAVRLIEWTFDPLEVKNAFFNLERLGVIVRRYVPNRYGISTSKLHGGLPTDRLVAEWWIDTPRVAAITKGNAGAGQKAAEARIEVPPDIGEIKERDRDRAGRVQQQLRTEFELAFAQGLVVTGFDKNGAYLLNRAEPVTAALPW